jgi:hypothetical protein
MKLKRLNRKPKNELTEYSIRYWAVNVKPSWITVQATSTMKARDLVRKSYGHAIYITETKFANEFMNDNFILE